MMLNAHTMSYIALSKSIIFSIFCEISFKNLIVKGELKVVSFQKSVEHFERMMHIAVICNFRIPTLLGRMTDMLCTSVSCI